MACFGMVYAPIKIFDCENFCFADDDRQALNNDSLEYEYDVIVFHYIQRID
jgi:hypothetical protein